jgi:hypothetical protein
MSRKSNDLKGKLQQIEKLTLFQNSIEKKLWKNGILQKSVIWKL